MKTGRNLIMKEMMSTEKTYQPSSKEKADDLFNQGFQGLAKITPMSAERIQDRRISETTQSSQQLTD